MQNDASFAIQSEALIHNWKQKLVGTTKSPTLSTIFRAFVLRISVLAHKIGGLRFTSEWVNG